MIQHIEQPIAQPYQEDAPHPESPDERTNVLLKPQESIVARVTAEGDHTIKRAGFVIKDSQEHEIRFIAIPVDLHTDPFELVKELQFNMYKYLRIRFV